MGAYDKNMAWSSKELKKRGLICLNTNFAQTYFIVLLLRLISDIPGFFFGKGNSVANLSIGTSIILLLVFLAGMIFLLSPLTVGKNAFYLELRQGRASFDTLWKYFTMGMHTYVSLIKGMLIRYLSIFAGTLLFIAPGVFQYYRTFFVPWILAEHAEMTSGQAMQKSMEMTKGQKFNIFIMQLTFVGWVALSFFLAHRFSIWLPASIGQIAATAIYALPAVYYNAAVAELYKKLEV